MDKPTNDNHATHRFQAEPDAHGQAALLLVESLIHSLIERSAMSTQEAAEIVAVAIDAAEEIARETGDESATSQASLTMLKAIRQSLSHDL